MEEQFRNMQWKSVWWFSLIPENPLLYRSKQFSKQRNNTQCSHACTASNDCRRRGNLDRPVTLMNIVLPEFTWSLRVDKHTFWLHNSDADVRCDAIIGRFVDQIKARYLLFRWEHAYGRMKSYNWAGRTNAGSFYLTTNISMRQRSRMPIT